MDQCYATNNVQEKCALAHAQVGVSYRIETSLSCSRSMRVRLQQQMLVSMCMMMVKVCVMMVSMCVMMVSMCVMMVSMCFWMRITHSAKRKHVYNRLWQG